jgi:hypothetical protein
LNLAVTVKREGVGKVRPRDDQLLALKVDMADAITQALLPIQKYSAYVATKIFQKFYIATPWPKFIQLEGVLIATPNWSDSDFHLTDSLMEYKRGQCHHGRFYI